jgi:hypothetical protein
MKRANLILTSCLVEQEHLSEKDIREGEAKAGVEVQIFTAACVALWFCTFTPLGLPRPVYDSTSENKEENSADTCP